MKKTVFISVPMYGKVESLIERSIQVTKDFYLKKEGISAKDVNFRDNFHASRKYFEESGTSQEEYESMMKHPALGYLGNAILGLSNCDAIVFGNGWNEARGCIVEYTVCCKYGIPMYFAS